MNKKVDRKRYWKKRKDQTDGGGRGGEEPFDKKWSFSICLLFFCKNQGRLCFFVVLYFIYFDTNHRMLKRRRKSIIEHSFTMECIKF